MSKWRILILSVGAEVVDHLCDFVRDIIAKKTSSDEEWLLF